VFAFAALGQEGLANASGTLTASPSSASFGTVPIGTSNTQTIQLKNTGSATLTISSASISGASFSMSGLSIPKSLEPAATVNLTVKFTPTTSSSTSGRITLVNKGSTASVTISLNGTGTTATRSLSLSSSSLSFGSESVGGTTTLEVTITNKGNSSVAISQMSVTGSAFKTMSGLGGVNLSADQTANLLVEFSPKVTGSQSGQIVITSDASNSPTSIALSGSGVSGTSHSVALSWTASTSSGVTGYYVYRATSSGGAFTRLNSLPTSATKYTDGGVTAGDTYYYEVTAVASSGAESPHSSAITAAVP
jgi:Abnormal spindle-like microcephaly-assoc'd, ASPM-SPD-2-Hydin